MSEKKVEALRKQWQEIYVAFWRCDQILIKNQSEIKALTKRVEHLERELAKVKGGK